MPDTTKKTLSGAIFEVLGISNARQKSRQRAILLPRGKTPRLRLATSRFTKTQLPADFYHDWLSVSDDEA